MRRLSGIVFVAVCLIGISSLALAADAMQESGKLYGDQREPSSSGSAMKEQKKEHKEKMKTH